MSLYVEHLLCSWGAWSRRMAARAVGFPQCSPMFKALPAGKGYASRPPLGVCRDDNEATDQAIRRLEAADRLLCVQVYQIGGSIVGIADRMGCHRRRIYERLPRMHHELLGHLNDIAAGR